MNRDAEGQAGSVSGRIWLHACCGPCFAGSAIALQRARWPLVAYWNNPNIHPAGEFDLRWRSLVRATTAFGVELVDGAGYDLIGFLRLLAGEYDRPARCRRCFETRLRATARAARAGGGSGFSTTLLISPYQPQELLLEVGEAVAVAEGIPFRWQDLRPWFRTSRQLAKSFDLYRQQYCGCIFSEADRYGARRSAAQPAVTPRCGR